MSVKSTVRIDRKQAEEKALDYIVESLKLKERGFVANMTDTELEYFLEQQNGVKYDSNNYQIIY